MNRSRFLPGVCVAAALLVCLADPAYTQSRWYDSYDFGAKAAIGYWPFDTSARDVAGGHDGVFRGDAGIGNGRFGEGLNLTGTGDYVLVRRERDGVG